MSNLTSLNFAIRLPAQVPTYLFVSPKFDPTDAHLIDDGSHAPQVQFILWTRRQQR